MEVNHVTQLDKNGCAIACIAMVLGIEYENAAVLVPMGTPDGGTDVVTIQKALVKKKCRVVYRHRLARPFAPVHILCLGQRASLQLPELTGEALRHVVVMREDGTILDPDADGRSYPYTTIGKYVYWTLGIYPPPAKIKDDE